MEMQQDLVENVVVSNISMNETSKIRNHEIEQCGCQVSPTRAGLDVRQIRPPGRGQPSCDRAGDPLISMIAPNIVLAADCGPSRF